MSETNDSYSKQKLRIQQLKELGKRFEQALVITQGLGNPIRMMIIHQLITHGSLNVQSLSKNLHIEQPSISRHLKVLFDSRMVVRKRQSNEVFYSIQQDLADRVFASLKWLEKAE